ncbi:MAG: hypothetical protein HPY45_06270 [Anaerolineae bacterium]|nr:hypothetical protein [Anaerolineae bacterium]
MNMKRFLWLAIYFLSPAIPITFAVAAMPYTLGDPIYLLSMVLGITAFTWMVNQFVISARPKFAEAHFGMDRMYRFHALMALVSITLAFVHSRIKFSLLGHQPLSGQLTLILFALVIIFALLFLLNSFLLKIRWVTELRQFVIRTFALQFNTMVWFHNLTLLPSGIMVYHVLQSTAATESLPMRMIYFLYAGAGLGFYVYHKLMRPIRMRMNPYRVISVQTEASNVLTVALASQRGEVFRYKPGQFVFMTPLGENVLREEHPFSISSSPDNLQRLTLTVKEVGDFTRRLKNLRVGDKVLIDGPYGYFSHLNYPKSEGVVFIAGGIGITPLMSMLRFMYATDKGQKVALIWGVRTQPDLIWADEIRVFEKEMPRFRFIPILSQADADWKGETGFISEGVIRRVQPEHEEKKASDVDYYLCGPPVMMEKTIHILKGMGIAPRNIRFERFAL